MHGRGEGLCHAQLLLLMTKNAMALDDVCVSAAVSMKRHSSHRADLPVLTTGGDLEKTVQVRARRIVKLKLARDHPQLSSISLVLARILAALCLFV
jgi:hypothetical protein